MSSRKKKYILITGGAGFIGTNLAKRLLSLNQPVLIFDNLSRVGSKHNLEWLVQLYGGLVQVHNSDIRDTGALRLAINDASQVFHLAGQVAVTTSLSDPITDFEINARGTLNLLETLRSLDEPPPLVFASTNKVYGVLQNVRLMKSLTRYQPEDHNILNYGFNESLPLAFHSPYGCSKGSGDQYVLDYARTFGLRTVVLRLSCIYGPHQLGTADQGWIAHFIKQAIQGNAITIYGDGLQVRDVLFIDDLIDSLLITQKNIDHIAGRVFNIGGGVNSTLSLLELINLINELNDFPCTVYYDTWRSADQRYYVSDIRNFTIATGWEPHINPREGVKRLYIFLKHVLSVE